MLNYNIDFANKVVIVSGAAGFIGMKAATAANARVAQGARSGGMPKALHVALSTATSWLAK